MIITTPSVYVSSILFDSLIRKGMSFASWVQRLLSMGICGVEIREQYLGFPGWNKNEILRTLQKCPCLETTFATNFRLNDVGDADKRRNLLLQMDFVAAINARIMRVFPPSSLLNEKEMVLLSEMMEKAISKELILAVENTDKDSLLKFKKMLDDLAIKAVGVTFDTGNAVLAKENPVRMYKELRDWISYVHLKDVIIINDDMGNTYVGNGCVDFAALVQLLREDHFPLCLEFAGGDDPWQRVELSLKKLETLYVQ